MIALAEDVIGRFEREQGVDTAVACRPGCAYCCHYQVVMTPPEVFLIGGYVTDHYSSEKTRQLLDRIDRYLELREGKDISQTARVFHHTACVFLDDHRCAVYPVRPLVCRAWHATDDAACRSHFESAVPNPEVEGYTHRHYVFRTVARGLEAAVKDRGHQSGAYAIAGALKTWFARPDCEQAWLEGDAVFHGNLRELFAGR